MSDLEPILRRRTVARGQRAWVTVGVNPDDPFDEAWTCSTRLVRAVRECLREDGGWCGTYRSKGRLAYEKPFVARNIAERELNEAINNAEVGANRINFTLLSNRDWSPGQLVERVFGLLVVDRVLRHPTTREFRPVCETSVVGKAELSASRPVERSKLWAVDQAAADVWLAARLLLLDDNRLRY